MKKSIAILLMSFAATCVQSQEWAYDSLPASGPVDQEIASGSTSIRLETHVMTGTGFFTSTGFGSGFTTFLYPSLTYRLTSRFTVGGGIGIYNTALFGLRPWNETGTSQSFDVNFTNAVVYLEGHYRLTDRLTLSGAGIKEFAISGTVPFGNIYNRNVPHDGLFFNADYKISEGFHIQAGFGYTRGYSPYTTFPMYDPYPFSDRTVFPGSFHASPFGVSPLR